MTCNLWHPSMSISNPVPVSRESFFKFRANHGNSSSGRNCFDWPMLLSSRVVNLCYTTAVQIRARTTTNSLDRNNFRASIVPISLIVTRCWPLTWSLFCHLNSISKPSRAKHGQKASLVAPLMMLLTIAGLALLVQPFANVACQQQPQPQPQPQHQTKMLSVNRRQIDLAGLQRDNDNHKQQQQQHSTAQREGRLDLLAPPPRLAGGQLIVQGPGIDLVALNRRRFELDHQHHDARLQLDQEAEQADLLRQGQLIEAQIAALPEQLMHRLPADMTKQVLDSLALDPALILPPSGATSLALSSANKLGQQASDALSASVAAVGLLEDPEDPGAQSIERLTKSCLRVHASSASADQLNVTFHLYTRLNPNLAHILRPQISRLELIRATPFKLDKPIKWITHGFLTNLDKSDWMLEAKDRILANEDANVILTDWRRGASPALAFYPKAAANAHIVAKMIVKLLRRLKNDIDLRQVHLIGHSLGAHIMGFVGSAFTEEHLIEQQQRLTGANSEDRSGAPQIDTIGSIGHQLIGRITACDPALPCFGPSSSAPSGRVQQPINDTRQPNPTLADWTPSMWTHLRPDSAILVEVMHSNPGVMGYADPLGDYDFYPNGSDRQPGCTDQQRHQKHQHRPAVQGQPEATTDGQQQQQLPMTMEPPQINPRRPSRRQLLSSVGSLISGRPSSEQLASITAALGRFVRPIRDLFQGYACSHHRSVELMVESFYYNDKSWQIAPLNEPKSGRQPLVSSQVCQMIGYRCADYDSFKRGFCFTCNQQEDDCRSFGPMLQTRPPQMANGRPITLMAPQDRLQLDTSQMPSGLEVETPAWRPFKGQVHRRAMPTWNQELQLKYRPMKRNQYYFDTKPAPSYCLHHYHLLIRYRWLRLRESLPLEGAIRILGSWGELNLGNDSLDEKSRKLFHRFNYRSYTMLVTHDGDFLGPIESMLIYGDQLKPTLIEQIELTYMSNMDAQLREMGSARLCRSPGSSSSSISQVPINLQLLHQQATSTSMSLFVKCPAGSVVR